MGWKKSVHACFALVVVLSTCTSVIRFCGAVDSLFPHQSIGDGQTLISANRKFELGFFSVANSSQRYVGIWYHQVSRLTTVWIANRERPVSDSSGMLTFEDAGSLAIKDATGGSFVVASWTARSNITAVILDTGNLVVRDVGNPSRVFWESFDHPTDTYLPGMKLRLEGGPDRLVTSWTSSDNPSPGDFSLGIDPDNPLQISIWKEGSMYWSTGSWNGEAFVDLAPNKSLNYDCYYMTYVAKDMEHYFTYSLRNDSIILKLELDLTGHFRQLQWVDSMQDWIPVWSEPSRQCDLYNFCGAFGTCNVTGAPLCKCMLGFQPGSPAEWNKGNFTGGCVRKNSLHCKSGGETDEFLMIPQMRYPANAQKSSARTDRDCKSECLRNCSCTGYAFSSSCTLWHGDLVNSQEVNQDDTSGSTGAFFLRLAASNSKGKKKIIVAVTSSLALLILFSCLCFGWLRRRKHKGMGKSPNMKPLFMSDGGIASRLGENERDSEFFYFLQIADATDNFSAANKLGEGGFGPVYKGQLAEGQEIAVKRLSAGSAQGVEEFRNEIKVIAQLQHRNLVRLMGYCIQGEEKMLVYEFMPNKSLDYFLFDPNRGSQLDWGRRFRIIEGIAQGLLYLHKHSRLRIIHRDVKASNILLDADMTPKISDFGMARIFRSDDMPANTKRVVGTYGYMSPEYALHGLFSVKSDVFSFGVLLLEIVSGKRNTSFHQHETSLNLLGYAWEFWTKGEWLQLVDPTFGDVYTEHELLRCIRVALLCVQESAADRPSMADVTTMLSSDSIASPDPKQPAFFTMRVVPEEEQPSSEDSLNDITFSAQYGR